MIKQYALLSVVIFLLCHFQVSAQISLRSTFIVHGKVYDDSTGAPLKAHPVTITSDLGYVKTAYTDNSGNYGDTINGIINPQTLVHISTRDCNDVLHSQSVPAGTGMAIVNFEICSNAPPPVSFNMGGLLFAGNFPINNPQLTGDTGIVYLYRIAGENIALCDSAIFTEYGYFFFLEVPEGEYKVKTGLTRRSAHHDSYIPTWYGDQLLWNHAGQISLRDSNLFQLDVHLVAQAILQGNGSIEGYVTDSARQGIDGWETVPGAEVILFSGDGTPLSFTLTDITGGFSFGLLQAGTYTLSIDYPGKYARQTQVVLTDGNPVISDVRLELLPYNVYGVGDPGSENIFGMIYPNPAVTEIHIPCNPQKPLTLEATILSTGGKEVVHGNFGVPAGNSLLTLPVHELSSGLYLLTLKDGNGRIISSRKFIKVK